MSEDTAAAARGCFSGIFKGASVVSADGCFSEDEDADLSKLIEFFEIFGQYESLVSRKNVLDSFENLGTNFIQRDKVCQDLANQYICGKISHAMQVLNGSDDQASTPFQPSSPRDGSSFSSDFSTQQGTEKTLPEQMREYVPDYEVGTILTYSPPNGETRGCRVQVVSFDSTANTYVVSKVPRTRQTTSSSSSTSPSASAAGSFQAAWSWGPVKARLPPR
jgi:hypothetical protein